MLHYNYIQIDDALVNSARASVLKKADAFKGTYEQVCYVSLFSSCKFPSRPPHSPVSLVFTLFPPAPLSPNSLPPCQSLFEHLHETAYMGTGLGQVRTVTHVPPSVSIVRSIERPLFKAQRQRPPRSHPKPFSTPNPSVCVVVASRCVARTPRCLP